jgi:hypothetical protein
MSPEGDLPQLHELSPNSDKDSARAELAAFCGIAANLHEPTSGTRLPLRATIRHTLFFCLQAQDEIASRTILFHSQASEFTPQAMRDVLPFFLGAVPDDHMSKVNRLRELRRELQQLRRGSDERAALRGPTGREQVLLAEARDAGLLKDEDIEDGSTPLQLLSRALEAPEPDFDLPSPSAFNGLLAARQELRDEFTRVSSSLANLQLIAAEHADFSNEADEQRSRLSLSALFGAGANSDHSTCPVCASDLAEADVVQVMANELSVLSAQIASISNTTPELRVLVNATEDRRATIESELRENQLALNEAERGNQLIEAFRDSAVRRAAVRGRISLFLGAHTEAIVDDAVAARIDELERGVASLEDDLDSDEAASRLASALSRVGGNLTGIAADLQLEHAESPARLDIRRLTVIADTPSGPVPLDHMGSGENWVGYHLAAMLGLHRQFIEADRPVPRFLVLDQPSQVYFPSDVDDPNPTSDEDRQGLIRIVAAINAEVERHGGALQVLLLDHADLDLPWFQDAVVERWRGGEALVPTSWIQPGGATS